MTLLGTGYGPGSMVNAEIEVAQPLNQLYTLSPTD